MNILTQTQINAYEHCRLSYFLKYVRRLVWPVESGDRLKITQGEQFHLLIRQLIMGFPRESLLIPPDNEDLSRWADIFVKARPLGTPDMVFTEQDVSVNFADVLWLGKFDALAVYDEKISIFDWKTSALKPDAAHYRGTAQTKLYRFLAKTCAPRILGASNHGIPAENIEMVYWFPEYPDRTIRLPYSEEEYAQDTTWLRTRSREMSSEDERDYPQTEKARQCEHCDYRTYCFPGSAMNRLEPDLPAAEDELFPDDVFQAELFLSDLPTDADREETDF